MIAPESVVTFDRVDGFRIVRSLGRARGEASRSPSLWRALGRSLGTLAGILPAELRTEAERVRDECLSTLIERADRLGANGVLGLRFEAVESTDGAVVVSAVGEAVVLEPDPAPPSA